MDVKDLPLHDLIYIKTNKTVLVVPACEFLDGILDRSALPRFVFKSPGNKSAFDHDELEMYLAEQGKEWGKLVDFAVQPAEQPPVEDVLRFMKEHIKEDI